MKLKPQHIQPVIMASIMSFIMTAVITLINLGPRPDFFALWARAFAIAWPLAVIAAFIAIPIAVRLTQRILAALGR
jgi:antibiotic biosynthesis monooxygenase (ABM) superfamily enzyme